MGNRAERGVVLGIVLITSVIFGIAAFGLLSLAMNQAGQANFVGEDRTRARYAAESGLVMAMQTLWVAPGSCGPFSHTIDTYNDADATNDSPVVVTATNCPPTPPGTLTKLQAKVTF